ncbi:MAG: phosphoribosylformylglycinamidine cyclo-ligase [Sumerlaeia bacterium]
MTESGKSLTYADAGVSIEEGDAFAARLSKLNPAIGGFSGAFPLNVAGMKKPMLVAGTDGVGTKLLLARKMGVLDTIGIDLVAMVVNDLLVCGAKPLFFLDYYAVGKLVADEADAIVRGIVSGCTEASIPLIGGETAEMPGLYEAGDFDLAGFGVGLVDGEAIIDGSTVTEGDVLIGLPSSGVHSNGYTLVRRIMEHAGLDMTTEYPEIQGVLGEVLLRPTRIYARAVAGLLALGPRPKAMCHITGGGLVGNLPRVLPKNLRAAVDYASWNRPAIFPFLQRHGGVAEEEMRRVFNLGIGYVFVMAAAEADEAMRVLRERGETPVRMGRIEAAG